jgi:hypothetical protein
MIQANTYERNPFSGLNNLADWSTNPEAIPGLSILSYLSRLGNMTPVEERTINRKLLLGVVAGSEREHIGGGNDNLLVSFTTPAKAGWILRLESDNAAVWVPASYTIPQDAYNVLVPFISSPVAEATEVRITISLNGQTLGTRIKVFPADNGE